MARSLPLRRCESLEELEEDIGHGDAYYSAILTLLAAVARREISAQDAGAADAAAPTKAANALHPRWPPR